jgi:hypothetical protein
MVIDKVQFIGMGLWNSTNRRAVHSGEQVASKATREVVEINLDVMLLL